ncbi:MAG: class I SAM-dependent methyltransferase [Burkholderiales bacterium]|nr:class I SAM-dependent methyltransferase [Burkholderiales bacterium]
MTEVERSEKDTVHAPHPPLTGYYSEEADRQRWVGRIFDETARDYDRIEHIAAFGSGPWYRRQALLRAGLTPGMRLLDVGVGTGLVACEAARILGDPTKVTGLDPSSGMLKNARVPAGVELVEGSAERVPFPDASFDFISMGYALRHIGDLSAAFGEFLRVLKPGGRLCILEVTRPEGRFRMALLKGYLRTVVPALAKLTARDGQTPTLWHYYWDTIEACASPEQVMHTLGRAGFCNVLRNLELGIFSEYRADKPAPGQPNRAQ